MISPVHHLVKNQRIDLLEIMDLRQRIGAENEHIRELPDPIVPMRSSNRIAWAGHFGEAAPTKTSVSCRIAMLAAFWTWALPPASTLSQGRTKSRWKRSRFS